MVRVVDDQVGLGDAVAEGYDLDVAIGLATDALVAGFSEDEGLAVLELNDVLAAGIFFGDAGPGAVIKDVAVLQDFDEGRAFVSGGGAKGVFQVGLENVHGASDESGFSADCERDRVEWAIGRTVGRRLGDFLKFGCGRVLALGQAVNAIVEEQHFDADVAAQHVNRVVAADGESVTVTCGHPDFQFGVRNL